MNWGWWMPVSGSIIGFGTVIYIALACATVYGLGSVKCVDSSTNFDWDCVPLPDDFKYLTLGASALIVQAIFTMTLMMRWQASRDYITKIVAAHHSLVSSLAVHVGESIGGLRAQARANTLQACTTFLRYVNLGHGIIYIKATGSKEEDWSNMVARGLLKPDEEPYLRIVDSPAAVFAWAVLQLDKMKKVGIIEDCLSITQVSTHLQEIINNCQDVLSSTEHQLPYPYIQLVALVQGVFILQLVLVCAGVVGSAPTLGSSDAVMGYVTLVTTMLVSLSLSNLFSHLSNPMGSGPNAFPQAYYTAKIEQDTKVVFEGLYHAGQAGVLHTLRK
jgi:hypothetical protein